MPDKMPDFCPTLLKKHAQIIEIHILTNADMAGFFGHFRKKNKRKT